jgi:CorA-like Mg2+ transporter protein
MQNIQKIDTNKDRQESAVYAFTIVTVIFLPLSTVASILGMNTNDVRNMSLNQWIFWAVALPLTFIVIILSLIWTNELQNFWQGFANLWRSSRGKVLGRDYAPLRDLYDRSDVYQVRRDFPPPPTSMAPVGFRERGRDESIIRREGRDLFGNRRETFV